MDMKKIILMLAVAGMAAAACDENNSPKEDGVPVADVLEYEIPDFNVEGEGYTIPKQREDITLTDAQEQYVAGAVDYSFNMLKQAEELYERDNLVLSPISASLALSMVANGAAGDTRQEIIDAIGFAGADMNLINEYSNTLLTRLPELDDTGILVFANSLWLNSGYGPNGFHADESFRNKLTDSYNAVVHAYDFAEGPGIINKWCSDMTNDLIPSILKEMDSENDLMYLANALYFKGTWDQKFAEKATVSESFTNADGSSVQAEMMNSKRDARYISNEKYALAELSYGNEAFRFQMILPAEGVSIDECIAGISGKEWLSVQEEMEFKAIELKLPKFTVDMEESIKPLLETMGMHKLFNPAEANFSNLAEVKSYVKGIQQATSFSIDEEGTEAAAVTIVGDPTDSGEDPIEPEYIPFHVTRPFLFILKETSTNSILFIGKVSKL